MVMMISTMLLISTFLRAMLVGMMARLMLYDGEGDNLNIWRSSWCFELPSKGRLPPDTKRGLLDDLLETKPSSSGGPERGGQDIQNVNHKWSNMAPWGGWGDGFWTSMGWQLGVDHWVGPSFVKLPVSPQRRSPASSMMLAGYGKSAAPTMVPPLLPPPPRSSCSVSWIGFVCGMSRCDMNLWAYYVFVYKLCRSARVVCRTCLYSIYIYIYIYTYIYIYAFIYTILYI